MMAKLTERERARQLYGLYKVLKREYSTLHDEMDKMAQLYFMDHWTAEGKPKEGETQITLPTHTNTVDMAHALLVTQRRKFHVIPVNKTVGEQALTSEMERFFMGVFHVNTIRSKHDAIGQAIWNALVKKIGWVRCRWDPLMAEEEPIPEETPQIPVTTGQELLPPAVQVAMAPVPAQQHLRCKELPIALESVAPENVFVRWGGPRGIVYLFYSAKRSLDDVLAEVGVGALPKAHPLKGLTWEERADKIVDFVEYWGWNDAGKLETATMLGDTGFDDAEAFLEGRKLQEATGYRDIPYVPVFCYRTPSSKPNLMCRGLLDATQDLVHVQERLLTTQFHAVKMFSVMPLVAKERGGQPIKFDFDIGQVVHLHEGQELGFPTWPGSPPDVMRLLTITEDKVQEAGLPAVAFGKGAGESGYGIGQLNEGARARLNLPRMNAEVALSQLCHLMVGLCETFAPDVAIPVWGIHENQTFYTQLTGNQMKGHIIQASIYAELPSDQIRNAMLGGQLKAQGVLSDKTLQERYLGIENPEDEAEQILVEQATKHPLARLIAMARVLAHDKDEMAQLVRAELLKAIGQVTSAAVPSPGAEAQAHVPGAPQPGMAPPPPAPQMMPNPIVPSIGQGQVLRQEMGLPPTNQEMIG